MRNVWTITGTSLRVYLFNAGNLFSLIALPVIMTLFLGGVFSGGGTSVLRADVLDEDDSEQSAQLIADLRTVNPALVICPADQGETDTCNLDEAGSLTIDRAVERVRAGSTDAVLVIPEGFGAGAAAFQPIQLPYYSAGANFGNDPVLQSVQAVLQRVNGVVIAARVGVGLAEALDVASDEAARQAYSQAVYQQAELNWAGRSAIVAYSESASGELADGGFGQSVPGMATFFVVFSVLGSGMYGLLNERKQGTLPRMATMPVRRAEIIAGKILTYFLIGLAQFGIVFLVGLVVGVNFGQDFIALLLVMAAYTLCITALSFALAPQMRNDSQVNALTTLLGMVMGALGGAWWPLDIAPQFMQIIGHLTPVAWAMDAFRQLFFFGGGLNDVLLPVVVLLAAAAALFGLGIRAFRFT